MDLDDPIAVALAVADGLRAAGVEYALYGALALAAYGEARETRDADVAVSRADAKATGGILAARGFDAIVSFERLPFGGLLLSRVALVGGAVHAGLNTVALVEPRDHAFAERALSRALPSTLRGCPIRILGPEDFVVFKILSTRDRDLDDAASVVVGLADDLDVALVEAEVGQLSAALADHDVRGRWADVRRRAGASP
jgi:hypothetical protein